jgi:beta-glucanase (GH16 family)
MFVDEFSGSELSSAWRAIDDWPGPMLEVTPESGCMRHENVSVSGGSLHLTMTANNRASCPQTWTVTPYYTDNYGASYTPGATTYDTAVIDQPSFRMKYGHVSMRIKHPGGTGPAGDVTLWGIDCQKPIGVIGAFLDLFTLATGRSCNFPVRGSSEIDITQYCAARPTILLNTSVYVDNSIGSPPQVSTWYGIPYYGAVTLQIPGADPATTWHTYDLDWRPGVWRAEVDGVKINEAVASWVPAEPMFFMLWNVDMATVNLGTLPQTMYVDYVRVWCPPGVPCEWSGTGSSPN